MFSREREMEEKEKWWKKLSMFQITSIVLIFILVVAIIVQVCVILNLKSKIDNLNNKNDDIVSQLPDEPNENEIMQNFLNSIYDHQ